MFQPELEHLNRNNPKAFEFIFLRQGLHDTPDLLRTELQKVIDKVELEQAPDEILLGYGFCGRGLYGVTSKKATLILPKVHDCIPLLLGDGPDIKTRPPEYAKTYWLSPGWIESSLKYYIAERDGRYQGYIESYGQDSADYLMDLEKSWLDNYNSTCFTYWDELYSEDLLKKAHFISEDMNLPCEERKGSPWYMQEFLDGGVDQEKFLHLKPGMTLDLNADGALVVIPFQSLDS